MSRSPRRLLQRPVRQPIPGIPDSTLKAPQLLRSQPRRRNIRLHVPLLVVTQQQLSKLPNALHLVCQATKSVSLSRKRPFECLGTVRLTVLPCNLVLSALTESKTILMAIAKTLRHELSLPPNPPLPFLVLRCPQFLNLRRFPMHSHRLRSRLLLCLQHLAQLVESPLRNIERDVVLTVN